MLRFNDLNFDSHPQPIAAEMFEKFYMMPCRGSGPDPKAPRFSINATKGSRLAYNSGLKLVALITGEANGGLEALDFDNHFGDAEDYFRTLLDCYDFTDFPIALTRSGGYHIYFTSDNCGANTQLALDANELNPKGKATIETRGEGGIIVCPPSENYTLINGTFDKIPHITKELRASIWETCRACNKFVRETAIYTASNSDFLGDRVGDVFNTDSRGEALLKDVLRREGWRELKNNLWRRPGKDNGISATLGRVKSRRNGYKLFHTFTPNGGIDLGSYEYFTAYVKLGFNGDYKEAAKAAARELGLDSIPQQKPNTAPQQKATGAGKAGFYPAGADDEEYEAGSDKLSSFYSDYFRCGTKYYFKCENENGEIELNIWDKQTIEDDFGKKAHLKLKKYTKFVNVPSHVDYKSIVNNCYNLYYKIPCEPEPGSWHTIESLLKHIFAEHFTMILDYLQIMYINPYQRLPIVCLVSKKNQVGKGTFGLLLKTMFGSNYTAITSAAYSSQFNSNYATRLIVDIVEGELSQADVRKIKFESTSPTIPLRKMHTDFSNINFFAKFIIQSNNVNKFLNITAQDDRFWVREIKNKAPFNPEFEANVIREVPAFLAYLANRQMETKEAGGRMWFAPEQYATAALKAAVRGSRPDAITDLYYIISDKLEEAGCDSINLSLPYIKEHLIPRAYNCGTSIIREYLEDELGCKMFRGRYTMFKNDTDKRNGSYVTITKAALDNALELVEADNYNHDCDYHEEQADPPF